MNPRKTVTGSILSLGGTENELLRLHLMMTEKKLPLEGAINQYIYTVNWDPNASPDLLADFTSEAAMQIFPDKSFDIVYFGGVPTASFDYKKAFEIANRVLKDEGILLFLGGVVIDRRKTGREEYARENICDTTGALALAGFRQGKPIKLLELGWNYELRRLFKFQPKLEPSQGEMVIASKALKPLNLKAEYLKFPLLRVIVEDMTSRNADQIAAEFPSTEPAKLKYNAISEQSIISRLTSAPLGNTFTFFNSSIPADSAQSNLPGPMLSR